MENIPLAKEGLGWILPAIIFGIIGFLIKSKRVRSKV
jgi:LIVCS family branched-chain amino acid:cation transporter